MMKRSLLFISVFAFSSISFALPELKGTPQDLRSLLHPEENIVTIRASAEETAYSDRAIVSMVVTTEEDQLADAIASNSALRDQLAKALNSSGITQDNIKNSKFSSSPQYSWLGKTPSSYKVINRVAVTIEHEDQLETIARLADQNEEVNLSDTTFEHSLKEEFNKKVKAEALAKVMAQKADYEQVLGIKLTPVGIRTAEIRQHATRGAMMLEEVVVTGIRKPQSDYASEPAISTATPSFDEVKYEADLYVDFRIKEQ